MAKAKYQLFDVLRPEEHAALKADIEKRGVQVPVIFDEDEEILDGHNRVAIAAGLGIDYPYQTVRGLGEAEKREYVIKINLARRHLDAVRWGKAFRMLLRERDVSEKPGPGDSATVALIAEELGVPRRTAFRRMAQADAYDALPEDKQQDVDSGKSTLKEAKREVKRENREREDSKASAKARKQTVGDNQGVIVGDFREHTSEIEDESVALIFTDPPYDRKSLDLYGDLAEFGATKLKSGGSLMCYAGQYLLADILPRMTAHLRLWWVCCCQHTGKSARMTEYGIVVGWKPILWFVKETRGDKDTFVDDLIVSEKEKDTHAWQQGLVDAVYYIEKLSRPGDVIIDPFCGGGTTAVAAKRLQRRWRTFEIDEAAAVKARKRIRDAKV